MKALIVTPQAPWEKGGVERVVGEVAKRLIKMGIDTQIYCGSIKGDSGEYMWDNIPVKVYKTKKWEAYTSLQLYKDIKHLNSFDLIHVHGFSSTIPLIVALANNNIPMVLSPHFHPKASTMFLSVIKKFYDPILNKLITEKAKKVICVSETEKRFIQERFKVPDEKIVLIPNGINIKVIRNAKPHDFNGELILYVGRLEKYKNIHFVIKAMKYLPKNFYFYIIGNGRYKNKLEEMIHMYDLSNRVKILSLLRDDEMYRWLKTCSVFISLSDVEAFGITVLEALAADKPVIVNNKLGLAEIANKFKRAVFPLDIEKINPKKLAVIIQEVSNTNEEVNIDLTQYSWEWITSQLVNVYTQVKTKDKP